MSNMVLVSGPPAITSAPLSRTNYYSAPAVFTVAASGTLPLSYQWFLNGTNALADGLGVTGTRSPSLMLNSAQSSDAGNYTVVVTNTWGATTSSPATLALAALHVPMASNDAYTVPAAAPFSISAPGVLANDTDTGGNPLAAALLASPLHGTLTLSNNGGFTYLPLGNYVGPDSFAYRAVNNQTNSVATTVRLSVVSDTVLASDDFARLSDPGPLFPWVAVSGNWTITGGVLQAGPNPAQSYAFATLTNSWTNYAVEGQIAFSSTTAWGGGIGGRLDPASGAHYAAWIYPDASSGGSNVLKLIKFQSWNAFAYNGLSGAAMRSANLPAVGTNWHTLKLAFQSTRIAVYYDGLQMISMTDAEAQPYASGGISADFWTPSMQSQMSLDNVSARPLVVEDTYAIGENTSLSISDPGVLENDTAVYSTNPAVVLLNPPANGMLNLYTNGGFMYTPTETFNGTDSFMYQVKDGPTNLGTAPVTITVGVPTAPVILETPASQAVDAGGSLVLSVKARGTSPLTYQWLSNATNNLPENGKFRGTGTPSLAISNLLGPDSGPYSVIVSNALGSVTSSPAALITVHDPIILAQPSSQTNLPGTTASFGVAAFGTSPSYQWLKGGAALNGETKVSLVLPAVSVADAAGYSVIVSNAYSHLTSQIAQLIIVPQPTIVSVHASNNFVTLNWSSIPGQTYRLQYRSGPSDPIWHDVQPDVTSSGLVTSASAAFPNLTQRYYRVILVYPLPAALVISSFYQSNGLATLTWNSIFGQNYHLQYKERLTETNWHDLLPGVTAAGPAASATTALGPAGRRFYRVAVGQGVAPRPKIQSLRRANGIDTVTWESVAGQTYRVQYDGALSNSNWQNAVPDIVAMGPSTAFTNATVNRRFFRVVLMP